MVAELPNVNGVVITDSASGNVIGGTEPSGQGASSLGNVIAANTANGVLIDDGAAKNQVVGNFIGIDSHGIALPGNLTGIDIVGSANNTIGGTSSAAGNVIVRQHVRRHPDRRPGCHRGQRRSGDDGQRRGRE